MAKDAKAKKSTGPVAPRAKDDGPHISALKFEGSLKDQKPFFTFGILDLAGPFGWQGIPPEDSRQIFSRLRDYSTMPWGEFDDGILGNRSGRCHSIEVRQLSATAQDRLKELKYDFDPLFTLRVAFRKRIWGYRQGIVLHVLWWDADHQVYPLGDD